MIMLQILRQIKSWRFRDRLRPRREFVKRFYDRKRRRILNPLDKRCPYWGPLKNSADAPRRRLWRVPLPAAQDKEGRIFIESPQKIFAFLMAYGPTPESW